MSANCVFSQDIDSIVFVSENRNNSATGVILTLKMDCTFSLNYDYPSYSRYGEGKYYLDSTILVLNIKHDVNDYTLSPIIPEKIYFEGTCIVFGNEKIKRDEKKGVIKTANCKR
ncbi:MAG: hypothetical protein ACJA0U_000104 [Salibacteraceae bacterium]|jgi:hypothetical protein